MRKHFFHESLSKLREQERGAPIIEYVIGLVLLLVIFLAASRLLDAKARYRANEATTIVNGMAPCGSAGGLLNAANNECL